MPTATRLLTDALHIALICAAPLFAAVLFVALVTGLGLAWVKLDDAALRVLPRALAGWLALFLSAGFITNELLVFAARSYGTLFELSR